MKLSFSILNEHVFCFFLEKEKLEEKKKREEKKNNFKSHIQWNARIWVFFFFQEKNN